MIGKIVQRLTSRSSFLHALNQTGCAPSSIVQRFCSDLSAKEESAMDLSNIVKKLNQLAHPSLAGSWDNVGLLVEPSSHKVKKILLTNDLTPPVLDEAISDKCDMIISYHPPIFSSLKKLCQRQWKEKIVIRCIENHIAVFSPHTTHDCLVGGVNDWLISAFECCEVKPVEQHMEMAGCSSHSVRFSLPHASTDSLLKAFKTEQDIHVQSDQADTAGERRCVGVHCNQAGLTRVMKHLQPLISHLTQLEVTELSKVPKVGYGMGRKAKLKSSLSLEEAVDVVKKHLKLEHVRLAKSPGSKTVSSVAVCAGSGSSVLRNVTADLYVTGEMSHHDALHAVHSGSSVILCEHSNTERGYLTVLASKLQEILSGDIDIVVSQADTDPLIVV